MIDDKLNIDFFFHFILADIRTVPDALKGGWPCRQGCFFTQEQLFVSISTVSIVGTSESYVNNNNIIEAPRLSNACIKSSNF